MSVLLHFYYHHDWLLSLSMANRTNPGGAEPEPKQQQGALCNCLGSVEQNQLPDDPDGAGLMLVRAQGILTFRWKGW